MTSRLALVALALLAAIGFTGCGDPSATLLGKWQIDVQAEGNAVLAMMASQVKGELEFKGDGTLSVTMKTPLGNKSTTGNWKFVKVDGQSLVLAIKSSDGVEKETRLEFTDNDHFSMVLPEFAEVLKDARLEFARAK